MILFPAIDLKDGKCVRLEKGEMGSAKVFNADPVAQALEFASQGFEWIHIVDLNGAFEGKPVNGYTVNEIKEKLKEAGYNTKLQLGGGIRDIFQIRAWMEIGISRVVLGTIALTEPEEVKMACKEFPGKIAVGIDAKHGRVATEGWAKTSNVSIYDLALRFEDAGVAAIIYTDIDKDGMMQGPNILSTKLLAERTKIPVIASGGVSSIEDLKKIKELEPFGVIGVISGRAIYDGRIPIAEALKLMAA